MSQEMPMTISSVQSLAPKKPRTSPEEVIEISDSDDEVEGPCKALPNGNCRRQAVPKRKTSSVSPASKISNGHDVKRLRALLDNPQVDSNGTHGGTSSHLDQSHIVGNGIPDENSSFKPQNHHNSKQKVLRPSRNGLGTQTDPLFTRPNSTSTEVPPVRSSQSLGGFSSHNHDRDLVSKIKEERAGESGAPVATNCAKSSTSNVEVQESKPESKESASVDSPPAEGNVRNQKQFLKPPSPKAALTKNEFLSLSMEELDEMIEKYGSHLLKNLTIKDIQAKAVGEMNLPKNVKVTPRLNRKLQFKEPISEDDDVIVISDDDTVTDVATDSCPNNESHEQKRNSEAKEEFMNNLQLFSKIVRKKPLKKDIYNVLKTRSIIRAYIANPYVSLIKANCIYKYVTVKGLLSSEQFRAQKEPSRRKKKAGADAPRPRRTAPRPARQVSPTLGIRRSIRKRAVRIANQPQRVVRHFVAPKLKRNISYYENEGVWTSYSQPEVTRTLNVPVIVLARVDPDDWETARVEQADRDLRAAQAKEYKCRWCAFHCLHIPSLRDHCFDLHGKIYTAVIP